MLLPAGRSRASTAGRQIFTGFAFMPEYGLGYNMLNKLYEDVSVIIRGAFPYFC
jgi:hypothetical protein